MILSEIEALYQDQRLVEAIIEPSHTANGWVLEFKDDAGHLLPLTDSFGQEKCYRDLDRATEVARQLGFGHVRIEESF